MAGFLVSADSDVLTTPHAFRSILDPTCGTAGLLTEAASYIASMNPRADVTLYGQEINRESWAISRATMMTSGRRASTIAFGNVFAEDGHQGTAFDYLLANPPFGVSWKKSEYAVRSEHEELGFAGRFGAGLPRINDGSLLFLQHMLAKMKPVSASGEGGSRIAVIFNGSPMYVGGQAPANRTSGGGSWRTTGLRPWSRCPISSSPIPVSTPICGSSATASQHSAGARYCC